MLAYCYAYLCSVCSALAAIGLVVIAFGTGGIKPCVASFGGDQFNDDQVLILNMFIISHLFIFL